MPPVRLDMLEWQCLEPSPGSPVDGLRLSDSNARALAELLSSAGVLTVHELRTGLRVESGSFVGRVLLGDIEITIRPKIKQLRLLRLLRYGYGLRELRLYRPVAFDIAADAIAELLIRQLATEVQELLGRGLRRSYVRTHEDLSSPRGRIDVQEIARQGGVIRAALPCIHHPRTEDSFLNRVLLAGIRFAIRMSNDADLRLALHRLAALMAEGISGIQLDKTVLHNARRSMNRLTTAYAPALTLIELLVNGTGISLENHEAVISLPGFLLDMNQLFQAVLSRFLKENLADFIVRDEYRLKGMLAYHPEHNPWHKAAPSPRPDYAILHGRKLVRLLDAKYMDLWERQAIGRDVLYQLAIYALSQQGGATATILYPTATAGATEVQVEINEPVYGRGRAHVVARPVELDTLEPLLEQNSTPGAVRERSAYAHWLAFGGTRPI